MKYLILISIFALTACSSVPKNTVNSDLVSIMGLIAQTEENSPDGVQGVFQLAIKAAGKQSGVVYLNTELNYRDRRNVTVVIQPNIINALTNKYGVAPDVYFINKKIAVNGEAKRAIIDFYSKGKKTDKYYFQTHIRVASIDQIKVIK